VARHSPATAATHAWCGRGPARPRGKSRRATATAAGGLFFPQSKSLGIDQTDASPAVLERVAYAGVVSRSFAEAGDLLSRLADLPVGAKQAERVARRIGGERVAERDAEAAAYQSLPVPQKFAAPEGVTPPDLAVVMADGGRMQVRNRGGPPGGPPAADEGWEEEAARPGHWREDKVGLLLAMESAAAASDPCPEVPASFLDASRIPELVRELKKAARPEGETADGGQPEAAAPPPEAVYRPPEVRRRKVAASCGTWRSFAPVLAAAAWAGGFFGAARRAFVGDGAANNWVLHRRFFSSFVPILDFIHALAYVYAAATAGRAAVAGWECYRRWIGWVWQGQVGRVLAELEGRQVELGPPAEGEGEASPRRVVAKARTYLGNHREKMRYDEYRRQGLPITSGLMESAVKEVSRRVKGTEKFWSEEGGEAILQLRADHLSDDRPLEAFWRRRQAEATGQRAYRRAG
jgi:hypothetical protein